MNSLLQMVHKLELKRQRYDYLKQCMQHAKSVRLCGAQFCLIRFGDPTRIILHGFLMGDLLRLIGPVQPIVEPHFVIRGFQCGVVVVLYIQRKYCSHCGCTLYSSLIIVISLQLRGCRQIAESRKYCLVCVIVFSLACVFSIFLVLIGWEFGLIPYNWYQSLGLGLSGSNGRGNRKGVWNRKV